MFPLVILVWGFVLYQLFGSFFSTPNYATEELKRVVNITEIKKDTFLILADYRDPFLGGKTRRKSRSSNGVSQKRSGTWKTKNIKTENAWPIVIYNGMIKNNNSDRRVGILNVGGKEYLVKENDIIGGVTVLSINKNTVNIRFKKEKKTITK